MKRSLPTWVALCLGLVIPVFSQEPVAGRLKIEPFTVVTFDGQTHPAELGHLSVLENRGRKSGRTLELAFVRLKSMARVPSAPIVYLSGGPGVPATGMARVPVYNAFFERLRQLGDVILLDQRGSGLSSPNLDQCPSAHGFPLDAFTTRRRLLVALAQSARDCADYWRSKGVDLTAYNTNESADDVDDLRRALGAAKLSLLGHSYGTELGLAIIRRHGDNLERAVLAGVSNPGDTGSKTANLDLQLRKIARLAAADPTMGKETPDLVALFERDIQKLKTAPLHVTITSERKNASLDLTVGDVALQFIVAQMLPNGRAISSVPALLKSIDMGDYALLRQDVAGLYNDFDSGVTLMGRAIDCAAGMLPERRLQSEREAASSLFGGVSGISLEPDLCKAVVGDFSLGPDYFAPFYSTVPTLFLSGTLDANTPPAGAEQARWGFPDSTLIVVENGFHETLPSEEVQAVVLDFLKGNDVRGRSIAFQPPRFASIDQAKQVTGRRH
jgi:pimeloyl-ACP methyl ester carboxylesterase